LFIAKKDKSLHEERQTFGKITEFQLHAALMERELEFTVIISDGVIVQLFMEQLVRELFKLFTDQNKKVWPL
jgi:hypothetical protein